MGQGGSTSQGAAEISLFAVCLGALVAFTVGRGVHAAQPPDAGQTLEAVRTLDTVRPAAQERGGPLPASPATRPEMQGDDRVRITVKSFRVIGSRAFAAHELRTLLREGEGRELSLAQINALAARITAHYRSRGYLVARAYVPAQDIRDGVVEIAVLEGQYGEVTLENQSEVGNAALRSYLYGLGDNIETAALERSLLLMNDLPGVEVRSTLRPGAAVGTSDLDVKVQTKARASASLDADNFGNRYTGALRAGVTAHLNSPAGWGDQLTVRAIGAGSRMRYARLAWQTPIGGGGFKAGTSWSSMSYRLGEDFASLDAHGSAAVGTLWVSYPVVRSQRSNFNVQASYDGKSLQDRIDALAQTIEKRARVATLGLAGDRQDSFGAGGVTGYSLSVAAGRLELDDAALATDQGPTGHGTAGSYRKLSYSLTRLQQLSARVALHASLSGQRAYRNLDSSEKLSLGGPFGVRAYPQGEAAGDDVGIASVELRWSPSWLPGTQLIAFGEAGSARINHSPLAADTNTRRLSGRGIGLLWSAASRYALRAHLAWRGDTEPVSDTDRRPRGWLQFALYF